MTCQNAVLHKAVTLFPTGVLIVDMCEAARVQMLEDVQSEKCMAKVTPSWVAGFRNRQSMVAKSPKTPQGAGARASMGQGGRNLFVRRQGHPAIFLYSNCDRFVECVRGVNKHDDRGPTGAYLSRTIQPFFKKSSKVISL